MRETFDTSWIIAKRSRATDTISDGMIASVSGRWTRRVVPTPIAAATSI